MPSNPILFSVIADICINLSAGWFGAVFLISEIQERPQPKDRLMAENLVYAMAFSLVAYILRSV